MDAMSKRTFPGGLVDLWEIKFSCKVNIEVKKVHPRDGMQVQFCTGLLNQINQVIIN